MRRALLSDSLKIIGHSYNNNNLSSSTWRHACNSRSEITEIVEKFQVELSKLNKARARRPSDIYTNISQCFARAFSPWGHLRPHLAAKVPAGPRQRPKGLRRSYAEIADRVKERLGENQSRSGEEGLGKCAQVVARNEIAV